MELSSAELADRLAQAADWIRSADGLLIGAGAGMGVDSGLPDFRGNEGFWKAYPPFRGRMFGEMSNPAWFHRDPELAWGFFGHRLNLYRQAIPHEGYRILKRWISRPGCSGFVFTSNVDGQFVEAGFDPDRLMERHGSIHRLQCVVPCRDHVWPANEVQIEVDMTTIRTKSALPRCSECGELARPNILMFGDGQWLSSVAETQEQRLGEWLSTAQHGRLVAIECGAGLAIPTVRHVCEQLAPQLIRINPRDVQTPATGIGIPLAAADALRRIDQLL